MSDDRKDIPSASATNFSERVREVLSTYLGKRGDPLDRGITVRDLYDAGIIELAPGYLRRGGSPISGPGSGVGGGGGGGGGLGGGGFVDYEPDLTPPPTPTGVVVTPTFNNIIMEHDAPTYGVGHGHARTKVYGATWTSGTLPVRADAVEITQFVGNVFAHPTSLGVTWHLWFSWITVDGVESTTAAGGANGFVATVGKVGHSDLGPLIIEADNLVLGAVTATKLADEAVSLTKFANGIEPVTIITSGALPTTKVTNFIFWTDLKLYRWDGTAYTKAVDGADIVADSITAGQIQAGAIGADEIAAAAIRTQHLLIAPKSLNTDPDFALGTLRWSEFYDRQLAATAPSGCPTPWAARFSGRDHYSSVAYDVEPGEKYHVSVWVWNSVAADAGIFGTDESGYYVIGGASATSSWVKVSGEITIGAGAKLLSIAPWIDQAHGGSLLVWFAGLTVEKKASANLIVDGAIVAGKLSAGAIAVGSAAIADGAIRNALIENLAVDNAKIASMSVAKLLAGTLSVGNWIASSGYVAGSTGWIIHADGTAEFSAASIRGTISASQINGEGLTISVGGVPILGAGTALHSSYAPAGMETTTGAQAKANTAESNAASDATTKANNAYSNAVSAAASDATTKANTAYTNAVYAAAADALDKADTAKAAAILLSAADATAKANVAAATATWAGVSDSGGKPENYATYGATLGSNVYGQINDYNVDALVAYGAIKAPHISVTSLSAISGVIGFLTSRIGGTGAGYEQDSNGYRVYDAVRKRVQLGNLDV